MPDMAPSASALPSYPPGISQEAKEAIAGGPACSGFLLQTNLFKIQKNAIIFGME